MQHFDVLVVGAGPAGSIASYYLSKKGLKVGLLEKNSLGRDKICGGGLSNYAISELPFTLPSFVIEQKIKGINFISPNNEIFQKKESNIMGITVYRSKFDSFLIEKAIHANVSFIPDSKITYVTKSDGHFTLQGKYSSKYVIGADGANSIIRTKFKLGEKKRQQNLGIRSFIDLPEEELEKFMIDKELLELYFMNHQPGYGWIFALKDAINIGIGTKNDFPTSKKFLDDFIKKSFYLRRKKKKKYKIEGFPIPNVTFPSQFSRDKVFLIGDAAGLVDPVSGEGIHYALLSGKIVADTILKDSNIPLRERLDSFYRENLEHAILSDLFVSYRLNRFLEHFFIHNMNLWFKMMKRNSFVFNYVPELALKSNYYDIYKDVLKKLPKIMVSTMFPSKPIPGFQYEKNFGEMFLNN